MYTCLCVVRVCACVCVSMLAQSHATLLWVQVEAGQRVGHAYAFNELYLFSYPANKSMFK